MFGQAFKKGSNCISGNLSSLKSATLCVNLLYLILPAAALLILLVFLVVVDAARTVYPHPFIQPWECLFPSSLQSPLLLLVLQEYRNMWSCCFGMWCPKTIGLQTEIYI